MAQVAHKASILVVDDNEDDVRLLERCLDRESYRITSAFSGKEALRIVLKKHPDLILLDILMPGLDGYEVCRRLKSHAAMRLTPVVMITGLDAVTDRIKGIEVGADDFLTKPVNAAEVQARVRSLLRTKALTDELERAEDVIFSLATAIEERDPYTNGHSLRVRELALDLAEAVGVSETEREVLGKACLLHDVGKIGIDAILHKPGPLTKAEYEKVKRHVAKGERICRPLRFAEPLLPLIRHHHEWWNGRGYPDHMMLESIPLGARIIAVADAYDAMTSKRPYRAPMQHGKALDILEDGAARQWDPDLVKAFIMIAKRKRKGGLRKGYAPLW